MMNHKNKTKAQLIEEIAALRERNAELEAREVEHQRTEQVQAALYRIAEAASAVEDMQEFYTAIHQIMGELMYAENFFIALYDTERQQMRFPYFVDTSDPDPHDPQVWHPLSKGSTGYVLRTGNPMLNMKQYDDLVQTGEIIASGPRAFDGAVVPLEVDGHATGVLGIQSYIEGIGYTDQHRELLIFVAQHIATALERARLLDDTRQRNAELAIINSVSEGLVKQLEFQAIIDLVGDKIRDIFKVHTIFIALHDKETNLIHFPYSLLMGQRMDHESFTFGEGLTSYIIRSGQPLLINQDIKRRYAELGAVQIFEDEPSEKSWLGMPILMGETVTGVISLQDVNENAFSEADVRLLSTLAANMGVALENARLFAEVQTRNREIAEALQQQTATGEILRAMAGSPSDIQPVFDAIAKNAANLAGTAVSNVYRYDGQLLHVVAMHNLPPENVAAVRKAYPRPLTRDVGLSAMSIIDRTTYNVADVEQDPRVPEHMVKLSLGAGMRSALFVPMIRQGVVIGAIGILRREAGAFTEKQVALLNTFADQAIIAIENVELFNETTRLLAESKAQVTELSTLNIISEGLVGQLDLQSVIDLVGDQIRGIIDAEMFGIALYDSESNMFDFPYSFLGDSRVHPEPILLGKGLVSTVIQSSQPLMLDTMQEALHHGVVIPKQLQDRPHPEEYSWLGVPIVIGQEATGVIYITKHQDYAFSKADVRLLTTIAANMGVAIENARLFKRIRQTNQELSQTLEELRTTQSQLVEAEKMAALGGLVAGVAHEINTPVGVGVTAASALQDKTTGFSEIYKSGQMKRSDLEKYLNIAEQSSAMILRNLERAAELIQSFKQVAVDQSSEERRQFLVKAYLEEILLSLRPKLKKTQLTIEINGDDSLTLDSYPGAFSQIVTNLVMNSLLHAYGPDEWGQLTFDLKQNDGRLIFEYNDDGKGIPTENLGKIFEPFFTTKRTQGGSGLGLHIIYNLVTQRLGGAIHCESEVGSGTKFVIEVPVS